MMRQGRLGASGMAAASLLWKSGEFNQITCRGGVAGLRAKHQTPSPKLQRSSKSQTPNLKIRCRGKRRAGRLLSLELGASLELGDWSLVFREQGAHFTALSSTQKTFAGKINARWRS